MDSVSNGCWLATRFQARPWFTVGIATGGSPWRSLLTTLIPARPCRRPKRCGLLHAWLRWETNGSAMSWVVTIPSTVGMRIEPHDPPGDPGCSGPKGYDGKIDWRADVYNLELILPPTDEFPDLLALSREQSAKIQAADS